VWNITSETYCTDVAYKDGYKGGAGGAAAPPTRDFSGGDHVTLYFGE